MSKKRPWFLRAKFTCPECEQPVDHPFSSHLRRIREPNTLGLHTTDAVNFYRCPRCGHIFTGDDGAEHMMEKYYPEPHLPENENDP